MPLILELPFGINIDMSFWTWMLGLPSGEMIRVLIAIIGWAVLGLIFFFMGSELWLNYRRAKYTSKWQWVVLAVDIPPLMVQTPKAVEQIFAHFSGARTSPNVGQKWWMGKKQKFFSLEIVSVEGYIQFLIRTEAEFRDLVEAAIYAQYPEAEITEVEDYVDMVPSKFPNDEWDTFGIEFALGENECYPIRTYPDFKYDVSKEVILSDSMASVLENFTRIGQGENFWLQIVIEPVSNKWKEKGIELVKKIIAAKKPEPKSGVLSSVGNLPYAVAKEALDYWNWVDAGDAKPKKEEKAVEGKMSDLSPGMRDTVKSVEDKIAKIGFKSKIRAIYTAKKEVYNPSRCVDGLVGSMNQFNINSRNYITDARATLTHYAFKNYLLGLLKTKFINNYKKCKAKAGVNPYILNTEELATLWHFPLPFVKTPLVQKSAAKRGEPPMNLPIESLMGPLKPIQQGRGLQPPTIPVKPPEDVPPPPPPLEYA